MNVIFYNMLSDPLKINKKLTNPVNRSGYLRDECNLISPVIEFEYSIAVLNANYIYFPDFNRYYFVTWEIDGKKAVAHCNIDVRYTYRADILNASVIADRSSSSYDLYLPDSEIKAENYYTWTARKFPYTFNSSGSYVLTIGG